MKEPLLELVHDNGNSESPKTTDSPHPHSYVTKCCTQRVLLAAIATIIFVTIPVLCIPELLKVDEQCQINSLSKPTNDADGTVVSCTSKIAQVTSNQNVNCTLYELQWCPKDGEKLHYYISSNQVYCSLERAKKSDCAGPLVVFCVLYFGIIGHIYVFFIDHYFNDGDFCYFCCGC